MSGINWQEVAIEVSKDKEIEGLVSEIERLERELEKAKTELKKCRESHEGGSCNADFCDV